MRRSQKSAFERPAEELWPSVSRPESPAESSVVQLYAGVFVRDRVNGQDVNLSVCRIDMCSDPYVMCVDTVQNLWIADLPNSAVLVRHKSLTITTNLARKASRLLGTLA